MRRATFTLTLAIAASASVWACGQLRGGPAGSPSVDAAADDGTRVDSAASGPRSELRVVREGGPGINTMFGFAPDDVFAGGEESLLMHYTGADWETITIAKGVEITSIWGARPDDVYAAGVYMGTGRGILYHYDGALWNEEREFPHGLLFVRGVGDAVLVGGLKGHVFKKTPARDWYELIVLERSPYVDPGPNDPVLFALAANAPDKMLVAGDVNLLYYFIGAGQWVPTYDPVDPTRAFRSAWAPSSTDWHVYVGANYFGIWLSTGKDEPVLALNEEKDAPERRDQSIWGIWGTSSTQVVFVGDEGRVMVYEGGADPPETLPSPTRARLASVWGSSWDDVWMGGAGGVVLRGRITF